VEKYLATLMGRGKNIELHRRGRGKELEMIHFGVEVESNHSATTLQP